MSEQAHVQQEHSFEGFSDFFSAERQTDPSLTCQADVLEVSVIEAAQLLGITERSVWRRIASKKLIAKNRDGKTYVQLRQSDVTLKPSDASEPMSVEQAEVSVLVDDRQSDMSVPDLIREMQAKLESAIYRNGYLESQLQTQKEQLQLLPDFQAQAERAKQLEQRLQDEEAKKVELAQQLAEAAKLTAAKEQEFAKLQTELERYKGSSWQRFSAWFLGTKA
jgi:hypothetical protein